MKIIALTNGMEVKVDDQDFEELSKFRWYFGFYQPGRPERGRAFRSENRKSIQMSRQIMGAQPGQIVDHVNGDGLDNQRDNLRFCTHQQNMQNRGATQGKKYKGVHRYGNQWLAEIGVNGTNRIVGAFDTPEEAALAYDKAARELFGEFARVNLTE